MQETCQFKSTHYSCLSWWKSPPPKAIKVLLKNNLFSGTTLQVKALIHKIGFGWYNTVFFLQLLGSKRVIFFFFLLTTFHLKSVWSWNKLVISPMEKGGQVKVYSLAQMTLYFTQDYYKMTDVNLKNFNNKVMLSKECSTEHKSGKSSTKWFHDKINLTKPEFHITERNGVVIFFFTYRSSQS